MELLVSTIHGEVEKLSKNKVRLHVIGDLDSLSQSARENVVSAMQKTELNTGLNLVLALSYSSRWEIVNAVKRIVADVSSGKISEAEIDNEMFSGYLCTSGIPDPELLIRTSGEERLSNFLLWQVAYSEFYFSNVLWPDFNKEEFYNAILEYQKRERRFGKTSEQVN